MRRNEMLRKRDDDFYPAYEKRAVKIFSNNFALEFNDVWLKLIVIGIWRKKACCLRGAHNHKVQRVCRFKWTFAQ